MSKPKFSTERFDVFKVTVDRRLIGFECKELPRGADARDIYLAFFHSIDEPKCVATITIWSTTRLGNYVEWIDVTADYRKMGVATEVLVGLEKLIGALHVEGVTSAGEALERKWERLHDGKACQAG